MVIQRDVDGRDHHHAPQSLYYGSKFALEGISGSLGKAVAPFGIRATALAPDQFRTDWAGRSMVAIR